MSPTTQKFGWKDRDTAARDLLQLVYHAPETISLRAVQLLGAIRSSDVVLQLLEIFRDTERSEWERTYALRAVSYTPGDVYLPELKVYLPIEDDNCSSFYTPFREDVLLLVRQHPSNGQWFAEYEAELLGNLDSLPPDAQAEKLRHFGFVHREDEQIFHALCDRQMRLIEVYPELLDLRSAKWLWLYDNREGMMQWLNARLDALVPLSLIIDTKFKPEELVYFLEHSDELRAAVFHAYPNLLPIYEDAKVQVDARRARHMFGVDLMQSAIWQELFYLHRKAEAGSQNAMGRLQLRARSRDVLEQAAAVHFLGKLSQNADFLPKMLNLLRYSGHRLWRHSAGEVYAPVLLEAGEALHDYPSPQVWEAFIGTFFMEIGNVSSTFFLDWIAYQTDKLSGLKGENTRATWNVERRPWFRALVEREMQAE